METSSEPFWYLTSFRNNFTTSPVAVQDLPHDYSRSQLMTEPIIEDSSAIAYLWAVVIHVISSASMTFASAAAGGPGSTSTPIVAIGLLMNLGHALIGLMKGQGGKEPVRSLAFPDANSDTCTMEYWSPCTPCEYVTCVQAWRLWRPPSSSHGHTLLLPSWEHLQTATIWAVSASQRPSAEGQPLS